MAKSWQLQEAKNKLSRVGESAESYGPQIITRRGVEVAVVILVTEYERLSASQGKLSTFFPDSPVAGAEIDLDRNRSETRQVAIP